MILFHKNTGIDGFFDKFNPSVGIESQSIESIKNAVIRLETDYTECFEEIVKMHKEKALNVFTEK